MSDFTITYDKKNDLFHTEIKGIPFGFSRQELNIIVVEAEVALLDSDPEFQKWAEKQNDLARVEGYKKGFIDAGISNLNKKEGNG